MNLSEPQIVICSNTYMEIECCRRILEYNDIYIRLKTFSGLIVEIWGSGLEISDCKTSGLAVKGHISSVEFSGKEEA